MNYHKIEKTSVANGPGVRVVLWVSGCSIHCCGCHNPETWDPKSGEPFDECAKEELFEALQHDYIRGITFSGGHPLEPENIEKVNTLISEVLTRFPGKDVWLYTGYTLPTTFHMENSWEQSLWDIISKCDVIVDGPFIEEEKDLSIPFRGSRNQRVIYVPRSYIKDGIIHWYVVSDEEIREGNVFKK